MSLVLPAYFPKHGTGLAGFFKTVETTRAPLANDVDDTNKMNSTNGRQLAVTVDFPAAVK